MSVSINGAGSISGINQGLNVTGGAIVGGALTVTGVLTYDDVTNIDSIGVVTARSGIHVTGGSIGIGTDNTTAPISIKVGPDGEYVQDFRGTADKQFGFFYDQYSWNQATFRIDEFDSNGTATSRLTITDGGKIGIGTDNPDSFLTVAGPGASAQIELKRTTTNASGAIGALNFTAMDGHSVANIYALGDGDNEGAHLLFKTTSGAAENNPYGSGTLERLRIASAGQIGLGGANYGTNNQVITSTGTGSAPEWRGVNAAFYGRQDTTHNITHATWTRVKNLGNDAINTTGWNESTGVFTANADTAGTWYIFGSAGIDDVQSLDVVYMGIMKNGANPPVYTYSRMYSGAANQILGGGMVAGIFTLADGDTISVAVYHNEGTTQPTEANRCFVGGFRLSV